MKFARNSLRLSALLSGAVFLLSGCLGGGGGSSSATGGGTLSGTAAVGSPIVGGTVRVVCATGPALTVTTGSTGAWQVDLAQQTPPCAVQVSGGTINGAANPATYHSIATAVGTVNITPLTDLLVANLTGSANPAVWFSGASPAALPLAVSQANVDAALARLRAALSGLTPLATANPVTTSFTPSAGNQMDDMLTALATAMNNAAVTYAALLGNASQTSFAPPSGFNTILGNAYAGTTSGGGTPGGGNGGTPGGGTGGSDTITTPTLANNEFGVRFATNGTVLGTAESGTVRFIQGAGGFSVNSNLLEVFVIDSANGALNLDIRWLPNTTGSYDCGDGLGAGNDQKTIALGYAVNNGYSSLGTKGVAGFSCNITVTHVGSLSGNNYTGYIEGTFKARLFKTGGPVNLADSVVVAGTFRIGTGPVDGGGNGGGAAGGSVPLAAPFVFVPGASDEAAMQIMVGEYDVAVTSLAQPTIGKLVVSYAGNDGEIAITLKDAGGAELAKRTSPALSDRNCADGRCLQLFDRLGSVGRISVYNFFDAGNTNVSPTAYAVLAFNPSGLLTGNVGPYTVSNGLYAFGAAVPAQFSTLAGRYVGTAQQQLCNPNPVVVEISAQGSIRITGKASVNCSAQDVTVTWDGVDDFIGVEADGQIVLKLDSTKIGGSQPGGGITLKLSNAETPTSFTEARLPLAGAAGDVTTVNAVRQ